MISARKICAELGGQSVLSDVSFDAAVGEHIALVGPNGAGKSTLLRILAGTARPSFGHVELAGSGLTDLDLAAKAKALSYLPQQRELAWDLCAEDVAALGQFAWGARRYTQLSEKGRAAVDTAMLKTGADAFHGRPVRTLSGGEQARVHLARTLAGSSDVLLLDEPCAALDIRHQLELMDVLEAERASGKTIITVLHDLELAERFASRILVLDRGKLCADTSSQSGLSVNVLRDVFGLLRREPSGFSRV